MRVRRTTERGERAEAEAEKRLRAEPGVRILERRYRTRTGEIDLIAEERPPGARRTTLLFVEVRYRERGAWPGALESVGPLKRARIERAARRFLLSYRGPASAVRFDVIALDGARMCWVRGAWG